MSAKGQLATSQPRHPTRPSQKIGVGPEAAISSVPELLLIVGAGAKLRRSGEPLGEQFDQGSNLASEMLSRRADNEDTHLRKLISES